MPYTAISRLWYQDRGIIFEFIRAYSVASTENRERRHLTQWGESNEKVEKSTRKKRSNRTLKTDQTNKTDKTMPWTVSHDMHGKMKKNKQPEPTDARHGYIQPGGICTYSI
jgi:hypothetical protein